MKRAILVVFGSCVLMIAACAEDEEVTEPSRAVMPSLVAVGVGEPPFYPEPSLVVPTVPGQTPDRHSMEEGIAAESADQARGVFEGEIGGVSFVTSATDYYRLADPCRGGDILGYAESNAIRFGYLPPGTWAVSPQSATVCPDGSVPSFGQEFQTTGATLGVWHYNGSPVLPSYASRGRIREDRILGKPAIVIEPVTGWGFGQSTVAILTDEGMLVYRASFLPLEETMRIVEATECACLD